MIALLDGNQREGEAWYDAAAELAIADDDEDLALSIALRKQIALAQAGLRVEGALGEYLKGMPDTPGQALLLRIAKGFITGA